MLQQPITTAVDTTNSAGCYNLNLLCHALAQPQENCWSMHLVLHAA